MKKRYDVVLLFLEEYAPKERSKVLHIFACHINCKALCLQAIICFPCRMSFQHLVNILLVQLRMYKIRGQNSTNSGHFSTNDIFTICLICKQANHMILRRFYYAAFLFSFGIWGFMANCCHHQGSNCKFSIYGIIYFS